MTGGLALISRLGNLGPVMSPSINEFIIRNTGDKYYSMYFVIAPYLLCGTLLLLAIRPASTSGVPVAAPAH
jgi:nitrate/nitrite transporter NarK